MSKEVGNCNCLVGTPMIDANGQCHCVETATSGQIIRTHTGRPIPVGISTPATTKADDDNTIFGFNPLVVLGAVAVGLYFLTKDGDK